MLMNIEDLIYLIKPGESEKLEFKEKVVKDIHHEIAAFANSEGGTILVGISDSGKIIGTNVKDAIEKITSSIYYFLFPIK